MKFARKLLLGTLLFCGLMAGCAAKAKITQYPAFYTTDLKTVAVVPFRGQTGDPNAANVVSDMVANSLSATNTYKVYNRNDLAAIMNEKDLQVALGNDTGAAAEQFRKSGNVQAILTGTIATYSATSRSEPRQVPFYAYDQRGKPYIAGYTSEIYTRNEANVSVTATLIRVSDGATIFAMGTPAHSMQYAEGSPPPAAPAACLTAATDQVVRQLVEEFAVVQKEVSLNRDKCFILANDYYDGKWNTCNQFKVSDKKMTAVVLLPANCDRNRFRVTIVRKDQREDLAAADLVWTRGDAATRGKAFEFSPAEIASKGGGPGEYVAKFYSGEEPIIVRPFKIVK